MSDLSEMSGLSISIHALREEGDPELRQEYLDILEFLSTPSARRATDVGRERLGVQLDFYPRPPRGGRHPKKHRQRQTV